MSVIYPTAYNSESELWLKYNNLFNKDHCDSQPEEPPKPRRSLTTLPTPILLNVLLNLPTYQTLRSLIRTCRTFRSLYKDYESQILYSTFVHEVQRPAQFLECLNAIRELPEPVFRILHAEGFPDLPKYRLSSTDASSARRLSKSEWKFFRMRYCWHTFCWRELTLYLSSLHLPVSALSDPSLSMHDLSSHLLLDIRPIFQLPLPIHYYIATVNSPHFDYKETFRMRISYWIDEDLHSDDWWRRDYWKRIALGGNMFGGYKAWEKRQGQG